MPSSCPWRRSGFTLVEVLVSLAVATIILVTLLQFVSQAGKATSAAQSDPYAAAENAFETIARQVAAATLEPYRDYADSSGAFRTSASQAFTPDHEAIRSDLDFVCGPGGALLASSGRTIATDALFFAEPAGFTVTLAHRGLDGLVNALGFFVEFSDIDSAPGFISSHAWRWRLKQIEQPSESLQIYAAGTSPSAWIDSATQVQAPVGVLAENVIALVVLPERAANDTGDALAPDFHYDSRDASNSATFNQLPSRLQLALVAIDSPSAQVEAARYGKSPPPLVPANLFQEAAHLDADLATLDQSLTAQKIGHRLLQRTIQITAAPIVTPATP